MAFKYILAGELTVILITIWRLQKFRKDWHITLMCRDFISGS